MSTQRDQIRAVLNELVSRQDQALSDPAAIEKLLQAKFVGILHQEIAAVKAGLSEKIPWNLRKNNETMATRLVIQDLGSALARKHGMPVELAFWVVESWALSLRMSLEPVASASVASPNPAPSSTALPTPETPNKPPQTAKQDAVHSAIPAQIIPTTRMGLIYGIDDRGSIRVYQVWWAPNGGSEGASALATQVKPDQVKSVSFFSAAPVRDETKTSSPTIAQVAAGKSTGSVSGRVDPKTSPAFSGIGTPNPSTVPASVRPSTPPAAAASSGLRVAPVGPITKPNGPVIPKPAQVPQPPTGLPPRIPTSKAEELYDKAMAIITEPKSRARVPEAIQWLQQSASQGYLLSETRLGEICLRGRVVKEDLPMAVRLLKSAAQKGEAEAQTILGSLYQCGMGVPYDLQEAQKWLQRAAKQGNSEANQLLKQILEK